MFIDTLNRGERPDHEGRLGDGEPNNEKTSFALRSAFAHRYDDHDAIRQPRIAVALRAPRTGLSARGGWPGSKRKTQTGKFTGLTVPGCLSTRWTATCRSR